MVAAETSPFPQTHILKRRGMMLVLASPAGGGKTTISRELMSLDPHVTISVSATTRAMRPGEVEGKHYYFVTPEKFQQMADAGEMLEYAQVYNRSMYGTPKAPVEKALASGLDVLFDIDWQGNRILKSLGGGDVVSIFLLPPSWAEMERRLRARAQDSSDEIARRMAKAKDEISHYDEFDYVVVNNDLNESIHQVRSILLAERNRRERLVDISAFVQSLRP